MSASMLTVAMFVVLALGFVLGVFVTLRFTVGEPRYLRYRMSKKEDHTRRMDRVDRRLPEAADLGVVVEP